MMKKLIYSLIAVTVLAVGGYFGFRTYKAPKRDLHAEQMLEDFRKQARIEKQSPVTAALEAGDTVGVLKTLDWSLKPNVLADNLATLSRHLDQKKKHDLSEQGAQKIYEALIALIKAGPTRAETQVNRITQFAAQSLKRLAPLQKSTELVEPTVKLCKEIKGGNDLCLTLFEAAMALPGGEEKVVDPILGYLTGKDPNIVQSALLTGESLRSPAASKKFNESVLHGFDKIPEAARPVAFRILAESRTIQGAQAERILKTFFASKDDRHLDIAVTSAAELDLVAKYADSIRQVAKTAGSFTVRQRAELVLKQKGLSL